MEELKHIMQQEGGNANHERHEQKENVNLYYAILTYFYEVTYERNIN